ncbi:hypothetical protein V5O48_004720 [Marasmius crinis-equi]|uniref:F-box domain-containing protein n=1 Tax=Marasmius crinis-equi TaxID=585013 RepID=A0ABR3FP82_9AGAR
MSQSTPLSSSNINLLPPVDAPLSPIQRLAPETLSDIFSYAVDVNTFEAGSGAGSISEATLLTQVCSSWRRVAIDTAEIWAPISVKVDFRQSPSEGVVDAIQDHLLRSKCSPLSLQISVIFPNHGSEVYSLESPILDLLLPFLARCRSLHYTLPPTFTWIYASHLEKAFQAGFPSLKTLHIDFAPVSTDFDPQFSPKIPRVLRNFSSSSPNLQNLICTHNHFECDADDDLRFFKSSFQHITSLQLQTNAFGAEFVLQCCPSLVSADFILTGDSNWRVFDGMEIGDQLPPPHPSLRKLSIHFGQNQPEVTFMKPILALLTCPGLESLTLSSSGHRVLHETTQPGVSGIVKQFLVRSKITETMETLEVRGIVLANLVQLLEMMPKLRYLVIEELADSKTGSNAMVTESFMAALALSPSLYNIRKISIIAHQYWENRVLQRWIIALMTRVSAPVLISIELLQIQCPSVNVWRLAGELKRQRKLLLTVIVPTEGGRIKYWLVDGTKVTDRLTAGWQCLGRAQYVEDVNV